MLLALILVITELLDQVHQWCSEHLAIVIIGAVMVIAIILAFVVLSRLDNKFKQRKRKMTALGKKFSRIGGTFPL